MTEYIPFTGTSSGTAKSLPALPEEYPIALFLNGRHLVTLSASPGDLTPLVTGYLITEQIIQEKGDIESIRIEKNRVSILTRNIFSGTLPKKTILSGCGGSTSYIDPGILPSITSDRVFSRSLLAGEVSMLIAAMNAPAGTGLVHGRLVFNDSTVITGLDIGRHNLVDRLIGMAHNENRMPADSLLLLSGKVCGEIIRKCLIASIPAVITVEGATDLAGILAEKNGITIGVQASPDGMFLISHPERIR